MTSRSLGACFCVLAAGIFAVAQSITGTIVGSVEDQTGAQIPAANIAAFNIDTAIGYKTTSNEAGAYVLPLLPAGNYRITIEAPGFKTFVRSGLALAADQRLRVDGRLDLGSMSEKVSVTAEAPLITTDQSATGGNFTPSHIENLPIGRSPLSVMQLLPGVQAGNDPNNPYALGNINGSPESMTDFKIDGVPATNSNNGLITAVPVAELVEQVVVQTANYAAEFGRGGTQVEMTTRAGTNQFHGTAFYYFQNDLLNANNFMDNVYGRDKSVRRYNLYGGTIGGPLVVPKLYDGHNRTFFSIGYQGTKDLRARLIVSSVPTPAMRAGDFSGGNTIYDPATTRPNAAGAGSLRDAFPGNRIPAARFDPVAQKILDIGYPLPNQSGTANNYFNSGSDGRPGDAINTRVDHNFGDKHRVTARYMYQRRLDTNLMTFPGPAGASGASNAIRKDIFNHGISADDTYLLGPNLINNVHFGFFRMYSPSVTPGAGEDWAGQLGLKNLAPEMFPQIRITSLAPLGGGAYTIKVPAHNYQFSESLNAVKGRHGLKMGFEYRRLRLYNWVSGNSSGNFSFNTYPTMNLQNQRLGNGFASFLLGYPTTTQVLLQSKDGYTFRWNAFAGYFQDDYRVNNRLTLNVGLRWETETPRREVYNRQSLLNLTTARLDFAGRNGYPEILHNQDWRDFSPRFGFAYTPFGGNRTVVRGAYGIFYLPNSTVEGATNWTTGPWSRDFNFQSLDSGVSFPFTLRQGPPALSLDGPFELSAQSTVNWIPRDYPTAYLQQWNLNVQRQFPGGVLLEAGYVGTKGTHLRMPTQLNQVPAALLGPGDAQSRRPYPSLGSIQTIAAPVGSSVYHSLQMRFERRFTRGLSFQGAYTLSKSIDNDSFVNAATPIPRSFEIPALRIVQDNDNLRGERSVSVFDITHNLAYSFVYQLPAGQGRRFLNRGGVVNALIGGWDFSAISSVLSGFPISLVTDTNQTGSMGGGSRPNRLGTGKLSGEARSRLRWFDPTAFAAPEPFTFGNTSVTEPSLRGPGQFNLSCLLSKEFRFNETKRLALRAEFFNALNHFNPGMPNNVIGNPAVGIISVGNTGRNVQLSLRLHF